MSSVVRKSETLKPYRDFSEISVDILSLYTSKTHQSHRVVHVKSEKNNS